jgi:sec-independent protein translocase protein TatC
VTETDERTPFLLHLEELRRRLIISLAGVAAGFGVSYWKIREIFAFLIIPLQGSMREDSAIVMIKMTEGFLTYLKLAFYSGLLVASPLVIFQIWSFVSPGLYRHEKRLLVPLVLASTILFSVGVVFAYSVVLPFGIKYLLEFVGGNVQATLSMASYVSFSCLFMILFGIVFQLPLVMLVLARLGFVKGSQLADPARRLLSGPHGHTGHGPLRGQHLARALFRVPEKEEAGRGEQGRRWR